MITTGSTATTRNAADLKISDTKIRNPSPCRGSSPKPPTHPSLVHSFAICIHRAIAQGTAFASASSVAPAISSDIRKKHERFSSAGWKKRLDAVY